MVDMMFERRKRTFDLGSGLIPLINVIFLLMIFFMVAGHIGYGGDILNPSARTGDDRISAALKITLTRQGKIFLNQQPVTLQEVVTRLHEQWMNNEEQPLLIEADAKLSARSLTNVIASLQQAGGKHLYLATEAR